MTQKPEVLPSAWRTLRPPRGRDPSGVLVAITGSVPLLPLCASALGAQFDERGRSGPTPGRGLVVGVASSSSGVDCLAAFAGSEMQPPPRKVRFARERGLPGGLGERREPTDTRVGVKHREWQGGQSLTQKKPRKQPSLSRAPPPHRSLNGVL